MKIKSIIPVFLLLYSLSCTTEEHYGGPVGPVNPVVEEGYSVMQIAIHDRQKNNSTYAGEKFDAYPEEKEVRSVAFFTKTDDEGKFGDANFQLGAFNKFFSTELPKTVNGLYEPLEHTPAGYTASIKVKSDGFGPKTQVYVIANYAENGLTDVLKAVEKWEDLRHIKTPAATDNLQTPLLMIAYKGDVALKSTQTEAVTFQLTRIVSRIDVINEAIDPVNADPAKSFIMESAQIIRPREYSYLLPNNEFKPIIPVLPSFPEVKAGTSPDLDDKKVMALYMYETDNQGEAITKTMVRIRGLMLGVPYSKDIPLKKPDTPGKDGDPIALMRNFRYQVTIRLVDTSGEVTWNIGMADWDDANPIDIEPTIMTPVITPDFTQATAANWQSATNTYLFEGDKNETVKFTVRSLRTTVHSMAFELDKDGASIGLDDPGSESYRKFLKIGEPKVTYSNIEQTFEVTTPQSLNEDYKVPVLIKLYFYDITDKFYKDSIRFEFVPKYDTTEHLPVKVGGLYWAPVNVGASTIVSGSNLENTGYYYQWGRNEYPTSKETIDFKTLGGPTSYFNGTDPAGTHYNYFITVGVATQNYDWMIANQDDKRDRNNRWSIEINDSPCPKGWHVPTKNELDILKNYTKNTTNQAGRLKIDGDEGVPLYIPFAGYREHSDGSISTLGSCLYIYSSTTDGTSACRYFISGSLGIDFGRMGYGMNIRCVQNIP